MLTEADFQAQLIELAHILGWHHLHVRRSIGKGRKWTTTTNVAGWPDLFLWHERQRRALAAELKSDTGKATPEQIEVLHSLAAAGIETHLWRPSDWDSITRILSSCPAENRQQRSRCRCAHGPGYHAPHCFHSECDCDRYWNDDWPLTRETRKT